MARVRLAVVLVVPEPVAHEVDGLRRAFGVDPAHIPPHITLVPPLNLAQEQVGEALAVLRGAAASAARPLALTLGPLDTFLPRNPVLYLRVGGELERLVALRQGCRRGPLDRPDPRPFVPHVTVTRGLAPDDEAATRRLLGGYDRQVDVDRLHLLVQVADPERGRRWSPEADVALAPRHVVGTGGLEIELATSTRADPEVRDLVLSLGSGLLPPAAGPEGLVVAARHRGVVVGAAWGTVSGRLALLAGVGVVPGWRRRGVGSHLVATVEHQASRRGASACEAPTGVGEPAAALLEGRGWTTRPGPGGPRLWRASVPDGPAPR